MNKKILLLSILFGFILAISSVSAQCEISITSLPYNITQNNTYYCLATSSTNLAGTAIQFGNSSSWVIQNSTLDCQGYNLDGDDTGTDYGVYLTGSSTKNNTIKNCNITDFSKGIYLYAGPDNNIIVNVTTASNTENGIFFFMVSNNIITNSTLSENIFDFDNYASVDAECNNKLENVIGSGNHPIKFFNSSVTLSNEVLSELFLCNADYSNITNVTIDASPTIRNNRLYVHRTSYSNFTRINSSYNSYGIDIISTIETSNNTITDSIFNSNNYGIRIFLSSNFTMKGGSVSNNIDYDYLIKGTNNNFVNTNFTAARSIYFYDATSWFSYNNETTGNIGLKTSVSSAVTITRKLVSWTQSLMRWNDSATAVTARYNLTGLIANRGYLVYNDSVPVYNLQTDSSGNLPSFTIYLSSEHQISVEAIGINVTVNQTSYLPNQTVLAYGTFYFGNGSAIVNKNVTVTFKSPSGSTLQQGNATTDSSGKYNDTYALASTAVGGTYSVEVIGYYDSLTAESSTTFKVLITALTSPPITIRTYPEEILPIISISKLLALRNLTYEEVVRTLGTEYKFNIEITVYQHVPHALHAL